MLPRKSAGKEKILFWKEVKGLYYSYCKGSYIRSHSGEKIALPKKNASIKDFYVQWNEHFPGNARKNAFDYSECPKSGAILMIFISLALCWLLAALLFVESATQDFCSKALQKAPVLIEPQVLKAKKKKRGNFALTLQFTADNGQTFKGKRYTIKTYAPGKDPQAFSIVYAKNHPKCWVLSQTAGKNDINWAKRRYMVLFDLLVGIIFFLVGGIGIYTSIRRLLEKRPQREEVARFLEKQ